MTPKAEAQGQDVTSGEDLSAGAEALREKLKGFAAYRFVDSSEGVHGIARTIVDELGITDEVLDGAADTSDWLLLGKLVQAGTILLELANHGE